MRDATRVVHAVYGEPAEGAPFIPGPAFASAYPHSGDPAGAPYTYGRDTNPTWAGYEAALSRLEGGPAVVFSSGMAAVSAVLWSMLSAGDTVALSADGYYGTRVVAREHLSRAGVQVQMFDRDADPSGLFDGVRLVFVESPSNPGLDVYDLAALTRAAHSAGALVAVDNTTATVLGQQPLALGVDFSVASDTKALTGHSDLLLGHVAVHDAEHDKRLRDWRHEVGAIAGPMETWLAHRSLATLDVRLRRQCRTAQRVAEALSQHRAVLGCRYPGLPDDPAHGLASRQMSLYGPVVNFTLDGQEAAERWLERARLVAPATSFGGAHTTAERRARWGGDDVPAGFIRLSVGLEDPDDLIEDVLQALG
jgi:cystathionine gamma-lyase